MTDQVELLICFSRSRGFFKLLVPSRSNKSSPLAEIEALRSLRSSCITLSLVMNS